MKPTQLFCQLQSVVAEALCRGQVVWPEGEVTERDLAEVLERVEVELVKAASVVCGPLETEVR